MDALIKRVADALTRYNHKLAVAESCTGGAVAAALTSLPGSSAWFDRGFVVYSNESKSEMLGVNTATAICHGSVSELVVREMVSGALGHSHATVAAALTGVAGPTGGTLEKPVGTVWLAWSIRDGPTRTQKMLFDGDRVNLRQRFVEAALEGIAAIVE